MQLAIYFVFILFVIIIYPFIYFINKYLHIYCERQLFGAILHRRKHIVNAFFEANLYIKKIQVRNKGLFKIILKICSVLCDQERNILCEKNYISDFSRVKVFVHGSLNLPKRVFQEKKTFGLIKDVLDTSFNNRKGIVIISIEIKKNSDIIVMGFLKI